MAVAVALEIAVARPKAVQAAAVQYLADEE